MAPVTTDVTKSHVVGIRRHYAGKDGSGNSIENTIPRYLRASTGSCHDACKYGGKHTFEAEVRRSIPNRATRKKLHRSSEESVGGMIAKSKISDDSKPANMSSVVLKESVDSKTRTSDALDANMHEVQTKSFDNQKHVANEVKVNKKKTLSIEVKPPLRSTKQEVSSSTDKKVKSQLKSISMMVQSSIKSTPKTVKNTSKSTYVKVETSKKSTPKKVKISSISTHVMVETLSKSTLKKVENKPKSTSEVRTSSKSYAGSVEAVSKSTLKEAKNPWKPTSKVNKTSSKSYSKTTRTSSPLPSLNGKEMKLSVKPLTYLNTNRVAKKKVFSSMSSSEDYVDKRVHEIKMEKKAPSSKTASRKPITPIIASSSLRPTLKTVSSINSRNYKSLKIVSNLRNQKTVRKLEFDEHNNNEVEEKTLYIVNMESENKTSQPEQKIQNQSYDDELNLPQLSTPESSSTSITQSLSQSKSEYTTSNFEVDSFSGNCETGYFENKETLKVEKNTKPRNVKEVQDKDLEMIKLKFRRGKGVDNHIEKNTQRRLKFRGAKTLDEQDYEDKKYGQLYNNMIAETASKLVIARKSKVKALVDAFESVISLQVKKPCAARNNVSRIIS